MTHFLLVDAIGLARFIAREETVILTPSTLKAYIWAFVQFQVFAYFIFDELSHYVSRFFNELTSYL